jgi:hypothetical protein
MQADQRADAPHVGEQVFALERLDRRLDRGAGHRSAAEGGAERIELHGGRHPGRHQQRGTGKAVAERLGGRDHVGHHAVELRGERLAGAAHATLHLVEHQQRTDLIAATAQRSEVFAAEIEGAADSLHRLDEYRRGRLGDRTGDRARITPRMKRTSKGARGKPYHLPSAPQVIAPAPAVRPWNDPSIAATCGRRVIRNAIFSAFSFASAPEFTKNTLS